DLDYSAYSSDLLDLLGQSPDLSDPMNVTTNAVPILFEPSGKAAGLRFPRTGQDSAGRLVFLSFPLDTVPTDAPPPNNRANLLRNILSFLAPGINGFGSIALDSPEYTIPSLATVEVADSDLADQGQITARFFSDTATNGVTVPLSETVRRGLFRGFVTLVGKASAPAPGQLRVQNGNVIRAEYLDASANSIISATAVVDTQPPVIQNIGAEPE